jgi:hypothetical protein
MSEPEHDRSGGPDPAYRRLPAVGPHAPHLGGALITWVEPMPEHVVGYNRWYEDDHMITGAMVMPWMFSCRRFVAPRPLQDLRAPAGSRIAEPLEAGKYIGLYWVNEGRLADHEQWALGANYRLHEEGRGSYRGKGFDPLEERRHVFTAFHDYAGPVYRDDEVPRDVHTLVQPYAGLVVELVDAAPEQRRCDLDSWLATEYLPQVVGGPVAVSLRFTPRPLPPDRLSHVREVEGVDRIVTVLHFLDCDPRECWDDRFASSAARLAAGPGTLAVQAAFVPTRHGTNAYTDELF